MTINAHFIQPTKRLSSGLVNWLLACLACALLPHLLHVPVWLIGFVAALFLWRHFLEARGAPLPSNGILLFLLAILIVGLWFDYGTLLGRDPGLALTVGLLGVKVLELHSTRDYIVVATFCYFVVAVAFVFSQTAQRSPSKR